MYVFILVLVSLMSMKAPVMQASPFFSQPNQGQGPQMAYQNPVDIRIGGDPKFAQMLQPIATGLQMPYHDWNINVLTEPQWNEWMKQDRKATSTDKAFSMLGANRTYLRQSWLQGKSPDQIRQILGHEVGHLASGSPNEDVANKTRDNYFKTQSWSPLK